MINLLQKNKNRHLLSMIIALLVSFVVAFFYAHSFILFIPLITLLVMQTSVGTALYEGMQRVLFLIALIFVFSLIGFSVHYFWIMMHDMVIGAIIGILANQFVFPRRSDVAFRNCVIPIVDSAREYFLQTSKMLRAGPQQDNSDFETQLLTIPKWIFSPGFDTGLQRGYAAFLFKIGQLSEVLFAMHRLARHTYDMELIQRIESSLVACEELITEFFANIIFLLNLKTLDKPINDFEIELEQLEKTFRRLVPNSLELIDIKQDYIFLAQFIYCLKDLRKLLMTLALACAS